MSHYRDNRSYRPPFDPSSNDDFNRRHPRDYNPRGNNNDAGRDTYRARDYDDGDRNRHYNNDDGDRNRHYNNDDGDRNRHYNNDNHRYPNNSTNPSAPDANHQSYNASHNHHQYPSYNYPPQNQPRYPSGTHVRSEYRDTYADGRTSYVGARSSAYSAAGQHANIYNTPSSHVATAPYSTNSYNSSYDHHHPRGDVRQDLAGGLRSQQAPTALDNTRNNSSASRYTHHAPRNNPSYFRGGNGGGGGGGSGGGSNGGGRYFSSDYHDTRPSGRDLTTQAQPQGDSYEDPTNIVLDGPFMFGYVVLHGQSWDVPPDAPDEVIGKPYAILPIPDIHREDIASDRMSIQEPSTTSAVEAVSATTAATTAANGNSGGEGGDGGGHRDGAVVKQEEGGAASIVEEGSGSGSGRSHCRRRSQDEDGRDDNVKVRRLDDGRRYAGGDSCGERGGT